MANKREFKKYVTEVSGALVTDMMATSYAFEKADKDAVDNAIIKLLQAREEALIKTNVKFDKTQKAFESRHAYNAAKRKFYTELFNKVNVDFGKVVAESVKVFNTAFPQDVKDELKEEAAK